MDNMTTVKQKYRKDLPQQQQKQNSYTQNEQQMRLMNAFDEFFVKDIPPSQQPAKKDA